MQYRVGDKVRIRKDLEIDETYGDETFVCDMQEYTGKEARIKTARSNSYRLDIDSAGWSWTDEMLEPAIAQPFKPGDRVKVTGCYGCEDCTGNIGTVIDEFSGGYICDLGNYKPDHNNWYKADELEKVGAKHEKKVYAHTFSLPYDYRYARLQSHPNCFTDFRIEPNRKQKGGGVMAQLSKLAKKLLDADTKALVKAGVLDSELEVTEEGTDFILSFLVDKNKAELAKEARKLLREQKKEEDEE